MPKIPTPKSPEGNLGTPKSPKGDFEGVMLSIVIDIFILSNCHCLLNKKKPRSEHADYAAPKAPFRGLGVFVYQFSFQRF